MDGTNITQGNPQKAPSLSSKSKILLVDDHPLFLAGVAYILGDVLGDVELLQASTAAEARALIQVHADLDWLFCDYKLPDASGLSLLRDFKAAMLSAPVVMVSGFDDIALVHEALTFGASGFIPKSSDKLIFQQCLQQIERGDVFLLPETKQQLAQYRTVALVEKRRIANLLTPRQQDVLQLVASGYSNQEIGKALGIAESTVKAHVSALLNILDTDNRAHCVAEARRLKLVV